MRTRYLCNLDNASFSEFRKEFGKLEERANEMQAEFERRIEDMRVEKDALWDKLWDELRASGVISPDITKEEFGLSFNDEVGQLFLTPNKKNPLAALQQIFGQEMNEEKKEVDFNDFPIQ